MSHEIKEQIKGFVALNPLDSVYHVGELEASQTMTTGQPLLIVCDTLDEAIDMAFTEYDKETQEGTPRQIDWIVLDTEEEAQGIAAVINTFPKVAITVIENNGKWLVPYADFFLDMLEDSAEKIALESSLSLYIPPTRTAQEVKELS